MENNEFIPLLNKINPELRKKIERHTGNKCLECKKREININ